MNDFDEQYPNPLWTTGTDPFLRDSDLKQAVNILRFSLKSYPNTGDGIFYGEDEKLLDSEDITSILRLWESAKIEGYRGIKNLIKPFKHVGTILGLGYNKELGIWVRARYSGYDEEFSKQNAMITRFTNLSSPASEGYQHLRYEVLTSFSYLAGKLKGEDKEKACAKLVWLWMELAKYSWGELNSHNTPRSDFHDYHEFYLYVKTRENIGKLDNSDLATLESAKNLEELFNLSPGELAVLTAKIMSVLAINSNNDTDFFNGYAAQFIYDCDDERVLSSYWEERAFKAEKQFSQGIWKMNSF